jgi:pyruvate dehydrogenase (quinone)
MTNTVAGLFVVTLVVAGVERIFRVVGGIPNGISDGVRCDRQIEWPHVCREGAGTLTIDEAHLTGALSVFAGDCGRENLHLINGLFDAHRSDVPALAIAKQGPPAELNISEAAMGFGLDLLKMVFSRRRDQVIDLALRNLRH